MRRCRTRCVPTCVLTSSSFLPFSQEVAARTADVDGVEAVPAFRQGGFKVNDSDAAMTGVDPPRSKPWRTWDRAREPSRPRRGRRAGVRQTIGGQRMGGGDELRPAFATDRRRSAHDRRDVRRQPVGGGLRGVARHVRRALPRPARHVRVREGCGRSRYRRRPARRREATAEFGNMEVQDQAAFREQQAGFVNQLLGLVTAMLLRSRSSSPSSGSRTHSACRSSNAPGSSGCCAPWAWVGRR